MLVFPSAFAAGWRVEGRRSAGPSPGEDEYYRFDEDRRSARVVFRKLASGGRVRALPQRLRRAGMSCDTSRND